MTFSELLALDKMPPQKATTPPPATPHKTQKDVAYHHVTSHDTVADATVPSTQETMAPRYHETTTPCYQATMTPAMLRPLRQAVRHIGKEAATYRFTGEEKERLAEAIYEQGRKGIRTCENEIVRIALNWLLADHRERGEESLLSRTLKALQE